MTIDQKQYYFDALGYYVKDAKKVGNSAAAPTKVKANISYRSKSAIMNRLNQIRKEAKKLADSDYQQKMAFSVFCGIMGYVNKGSD